VATSTGQASTTVLSGIGDPAASPVVTLTPTSLGFGNVTVRVQSAAQTISVKNTGTAPLNVTAVTRNGAAAADYLVTTATATPCVGVSVVPGATCTIQVRFSPSAIGLRSASLTLTHNPAGASQATSSSVPLSGTGLGSILNSTATPVKFGTVDRNTSKDQTVTIKNTGNAAAALSLASFSTTGTGYSVRSTTCGNLAVNNTCNVVVRFTAPNVVNTFNGTLNVTAANGVPATQQVALTATTR
jgi:Abnormal spindle-like microcephaly-assoc'd, ASPM-SPD-2-Hydin